MKKLSRIIVMTLLSVLMLSTVASAKTITLKGDCYTWDVANINKVSTTIKLGKTTAKFNEKAKYPDGGYLKFKAPKAGKYKIIIDNFNSGENTNYNVGHAKICKKVDLI